MPTSDELNKLLEMIKAQAGQSVADSAASMLATAQPQAQEQPVAQEPVQQPDPIKEMTREAMNQMYQKRPILNGPERQAAKALINYKNAWGQADNPDVQKAMELNADQIRDLSSKGADNLRQIANGAGMNLTGYGADVSLTDALRNLQSNDARARIEALQGQYAMTSDQFFDRKYDELLLNGSSAREAKAVAGKLAQRYQADRVSYLQGMYHGYGRDGNYTNDFGVDVIGAIANENPLLANLYATVFPNPKDAQTRANTIEDEFIKQNNALSLINAGTLGDIQKIWEQGKVNDILSNNTFFRNEYSKDADVGREKQKYADRKDIELGYQKTIQQLKTDEERRAYDEKATRLYYQLTSLGLTGEALKAAWAKGMGIPYPGTDTGGIQLDAKQLERATAQYNAYANEEKTLLQYINDPMTSEDLKATLEKRLQEIQTYKGEFDSVFGVGFNNQTGQRFIAYTGDFDKDSKTVMEQIAPWMVSKGADEDEIAAYLVNDWSQKKLTVDQAKALIRGQKTTGQKIGEGVATGVFGPVINRFGNR